MGATDPLMSTRWLRTFALGGMLVMPGTAFAQSAAPAPAPHVPLFTLEDAYLAGGFIAGTLALRPLDEHFARRLQDKNSQSSRFLQNVAVTFRTIAEPGAFFIGGGLYIAGRASKQRDMADLGLHGTEAVVLGSVFAGVLKDAFGRARPFVHPPTDSTGFNPNDWQFGRGLTNGDQYRSFPSGHSVAAFAAAAAVVNETSRWWPNLTWVIGPAMYGGAGIVGLSRMYNNRHWASDVMMGAAIGTFAGNKVVRYHHRTNPTNRFDQWLLGASVHQSANGSYSSFAWSFAPAPR
jgi:membrane-associated phospholipid phosphatase